MPHISKNQLDDKLFLRLYNQFTEAVTSSLSNKKDVLGDILTETEKVMFAKRLAVIFMLLEGASSYRIEQILKMSPSTTRRFREGLYKEHYTEIEKLFRSKKKKKDFWLTLEVVIRAGMPEMGKGRWKWLEEMDKKYL